MIFVFCRHAFGKKLDAFRYRSFEKNLTRKSPPKKVHGKIQLEFCIKISSIVSATKNNKTKLREKQIAFHRKTAFHASLHEVFLKYKIENLKQVPPI